MIDSPVRQGKQMLRHYPLPAETAKLSAASLRRTGEEEPVVAGLHVEFVEELRGVLERRHRVEHVGVVLHRLLRLRHGGWAASAGRELTRHLLLEHQLRQAHTSGVRETKAAQSTAQGVRLTLLWSSF